MCGWGLLNTCTYTYPSTFDTPICIRGHHELECRRKGDNDFDRYAVAVLRRSVVVGHPQLLLTSRYVMAGTVGHSCWLPWAPLQIEEYSHSRQAVSFLTFYSLTCRRSHVVLYHIFLFYGFNIDEFKFTLAYFSLI